MYHLKLSKALSYSGIVSATSHDPDVYTDDVSICNAAIATGYFTLLGVMESHTKEVPDTENTGRRFADMTVEELKTYAGQNGISIKGLSKKDELIDRIEASAPETDSMEDPFDAEGADNA